MSATGARRAGSSCLAVLLLATACRREPAPPPRDALQQALRASGRSEIEARGHRSFLARCATCHGSEGRGDGQNAYNLDPQPPDFQESLARLSPADRRKVIVSGTVSLGRSPLCPARGSSLDTDEVEALLAWLDAAARKAPETKQ